MAPVQNHILHQILRHDDHLPAEMLGNRLPSQGAPEGCGEGVDPVHRETMGKFCFGGAEIGKTLSVKGILRPLDGEGYGGNLQIRLLLVV